MRGFKKIVSIIIAVSMLITVVPAGQQVNAGSVRNKLPSNDMAVTLQKLDESVIKGLQEYNEEDYNDKTQLTQAVEGYNWKKYTSNYYYNKLGKDGKKLWKQLESYCNKLMTGGPNIKSKNNIYYTASFKGPKNYNDAYFAWYSFVLSHPQYYFINNRAGVGGGRIVCTVFPKFAKASVRKKMTEKIKINVEKWMDDIKENSKEGYDRLRTAALYVCEKVEYDYNAVETNNLNKLLWDQGVVSALIEKKTVCAGYSKLYSMIVEGLGYDAVTVVSPSHGWNNVKIGKTWYVVDTTWGDQIQYASEGFLFVSNKAIKDGAHTPDSTFKGKIPKCNKDYKASKSYIANNLTYNEKGNTIQLSSDCWDSSIYYTLDGSVPTQDSTLYSQPISTEGLVRGQKIRAAIYNSYNDKSRVWTFYYQEIAKPTITTLINSKKGITIKWQISNNASGYKIMRKEGKGKYRTIKTINSKKTLSYTDKKVKKGKKYTYFVVAFNKDKCESRNSHAETLTRKK